MSSTLGNKVTAAELLAEAGSPVDFARMFEAALTMERLNALDEAAQLADDEDCNELASMIRRRGDYHAAAAEPTCATCGDTKKVVTGRGVLKGARPCPDCAAAESDATDRCLFTGNECGTDTWPVLNGKMIACECASCQAYVRLRRSTFTFDKAAEPEAKAVVITPCRACSGLGSVRSIDLGGSADLDSFSTNFRPCPHCGGAR